MNYLTTPEGFVNHVASLNNQDEIINACIDLLEYLKEQYALSTVNKKISGYRKPLYGFVSEFDDLNEIVEVRQYHPEGEFEFVSKKGDVKRFDLVEKTQHVAARLLSLSQEELMSLLNK